MKQLHMQLEAALQRPLPGGQAHRWLAPQPRPGWDPGRDPPTGRPAAVLVLVYPGGGGGAPQAWGSGGSVGTAPALVLTERTGFVEWHKHQVAYPGGLIEPGETVEQAALREAREEIDLSPEGVLPLGRLSPLYVPATGFTIHPLVGLAPARPRLRPNAAEVQRILETPLAFLLDSASLRCAESMMEGAWVRVPYFDLDGARLWGASAMITAELLALLGWGGPLRDGGASPETD